MFNYNRVASFRARPNHVTILSDYPDLRDEDISFYGLMTYAMQVRAIDVGTLPGRPTFSFTEADRQQLESSLADQDLTVVQSRLEVCRLVEERPLGLITSDVYKLGGMSMHGLAILEKSEGICSLRGM